MGAPRTVAASLALVLLALAGCGDDGDDPAAADPDQPSTTSTSTTLPTAEDDPLGGFEPAALEWTDCGGGLQCADLEVPLDWSAPDGETITLAVTRVPASNRVADGAVATNPGGPGASGNDFLASGTPFEGELARRYDTISWDPRGLGGSAPLDCATAEITAFQGLDSDPDTPEEQTALEAAADAVAAACAAGPTADLLPHVGTGAVARDLEAIRRAYGAPMAYVGFSYGTAVGLEHLRLFPGAMPVVLDGVVDPNDTLADLLRGQAAGFERVIADVFASCPDSSGECPDGGARAAYEELAAEVEDQPIPGDTGELGPEDLRAAVVLSAYSEGYWPILMAGLTSAQAGDATGLLDIAARYRDLVAWDLYQAVSCTDSVNPTGTDGWLALADELAEISPDFGRSIANEMLPCATWRVPPSPITGPVVAEGAGPVVVIGTTGDAATPVEQAERVAEELADGRLVVLDGEGHVAYMRSPCVQEVVEAFIVRGEAPDDGTRC